MSRVTFDNCVVSINIQMKFYWECLLSATYHFLQNVRWKKVRRKTRSSRFQMFLKIGVLENLAIFTGKHLCRCLKLQAFRFATLLKRDTTQVFSCEYYELFSSSYFKEHLQMAASSKFLRKHTIAWFFFVILSAFMKQKYFEQSFCFSFFFFLGVGGIDL